MDYRSIPIQDIINSGNIENTLKRLLQMQQHTGKNFIDAVVVMTPHKIVDEMLDMLPSEIWSHKTTFLNMGCKDGIFLIKIFQRLMKIENTEFKTDTEKAWHILENQLYAICVDETIGKLLSTLIYGQSALGEEHIAWFNSTVSLKASLNFEYVDKFILSKFRENREEQQMKFDVIIGNPPYQDGNQSIYQHFIDLAMKWGGGRPYSNDY